MSDRALDLAKGVSKSLGARKKSKKELEYEKSDRPWMVNVGESFLKDLLEGAASPGTDMMLGMANKDLPRFAKGLGVGAASGAANIALPAGARLLKKFGEEAKGALDEGIQYTGRRLGDETGAVGNVAAAKALTKAKKLIEDAGGKVGKRSGDTLHWRDEGGNKRAFDLNGRIGARQVGTNPRMTGDNPRALDEDIVDKTRGEDYETMRANRDDIRSRAEDASKLPPMKKEMRVGQPKMDDDYFTGLNRKKEDITSLHAQDSSISTEEAHRAGRFYKMGKSGEPTYLGKKPDAGKLNPDEAIIHVKGNTPEIYQGSGTASTLERFKNTKTFKSLQPTEVNAGVPIKPGKVRQTLEAKRVPEVDIPGRFKLKDSYGKKKIGFASDFDKAAYNLALGNKPNSDLLAEISMQTGFDNDTILQHGIKIKNRVDKMGIGGAPIKLEPRSVQVLGPAKEDSMIKQVLGLPSEFKFSIDLPALRQSFRPTVQHPFSSGLPALKNSFKAFSEKGYRQGIENLIEESPVYKNLDIATALGPSKAKELFPNIEPLQKLAGGKGDLYEYFTGSSLGEKAPFGLGNLPKKSKQMYDMYQRTIRGKEMERLASKGGTSIEEMISGGKGADDLANMVKLTNERTGYGPMPGTSAENLSYLFTAPRNLSAKLQLNNPLNLFPKDEGASGLQGFLQEHGAAGRYGSGTAYKDYATDQAKLAALYGAGLFGASQMGADVEPNPLASNFGVRFGNYKPDIFGGELGIPKTLARMTSHDRVSSKGSDYEGSPLTDLARFGRGRLRPGLPSMTYDALDYEPDVKANVNYAGEDIKLPYEEGSPGRKAIDFLSAGSLGDKPYTREIAEQFTPAYPEDIYDAFNVEGPAAGLAQVPLGLLGMGSTSYDPFTPSPYKPLRKFIRIEKGKKGGHGHSGASNSGYGNTIR